MSRFSLPPDLVHDVDRVDAIVRERVASRAAVLEIASRSIAPEKARALAALTLLAARLGPHPNTEAALHAAATVELIYASSRVHDALMDEGERRRGQATGEKWTGDVALMVGDYLFALAAAEMALAPDPRIISYFSQSVMAICEGQLAPVASVMPFDDAVAQYMYKVGSETGALFRAAAKAGLVCGDGQQDQIDHLGEVGYLLGVAWHILDDTRDIDVAPSDEQPRGRSLRAGVITLPLIYAAEAEPQLQWEQMLAFGAPKEAHVEAMLAAVERTGAVQRTVAEAHRHVQRALVLLNQVPDSAAKQMVRDLVQSVGS